MTLFTLFKTKGSKDKKREGFLLYKKSYSLFPSFVKSEGASFSQSFFFVKSVGDGSESLPEECTALGWFVVDGGTRPPTPTPHPPQTNLGQPTPKEQEEQ